MHILGPDSDLRVLLKDRYTEKQLKEIFSAKVYRIRTLQKQCGHDFKPVSTIKSGNLEMVQRFLCPDCGFFLNVGDFENLNHNINMLTDMWSETSELQRTDDS